MIGIICFLIVIVLANILNHYSTSPLYHDGVSFLNANFWLLILICLILFVADLFGSISFPLNLPAPIIRAIGSVFCIAFILRVFEWLDHVAATSFYQMFWLLSFLIIPLVFLVVIAVGYIEIMRQLWWMPKTRPDQGAQVVNEIPPVAPEGNASEVTSDVKTWEEIGVEFRLMLYDLLHCFRQEIKRR
ncbi:MAG: hypothetical protein M0Q92_09295 [Methanoregula sp.]|jgi:predicted membrane protein|nr:hypothetical protein [Methanoregula sp.]